MAPAPKGNEVKTSSAHRSKWESKAVTPTRQNECVGAFSSSQEERGGAGIFAKNQSE